MEQGMLDIGLIYLFSNLLGNQKGYPWFVRVAKIKTC